MALELLGAGRVDKCVPVLMGKELEQPDQATGSTVGTLFAAPGPSQLPDVVHQRGRHLAIHPRHPQPARAALGRAQLPHCARHCDGARQVPRHHGLEPER
eukprot:1239162-Rhodomonas_salina.1